MFEGRQGSGIGLVGLFQVSSKGRRVKSGTRRFEHGRLQGGVYIHQGGVCWISVEYVYSLVMTGVEL